MGYNLLTRPHMIFAAIVAIAAAALAFVATERSGDPQAVIAEAMRRLSAVQSTVERHTYQLREADSPKPTDHAHSLYRLSGPKGETLFVEGPADPNTSEVERIVFDLYQTGKKSYVAHDSAWAEVQRIWASMTWSNKQTAEAKALRQFDTKPTDASSYDWDYRFRKSNEPWHVQEVSDFQARRAFYSGGAAIAAFTFVVLALAATGWLWRALLARIREFANAVRGQ